MPENNKRSTILVVDDDPNNLSVFGSLLSGEYRILVASNGEIGLDLAASQRPDLVLLDVMMPGLGGYAVCAKLKTEDETKDIPVIFVTSMSDTQHESEGFLVGGVDYVIKPVNPIILRARIKTHLDLKQKTDELRSLAVKDFLTGLANRHRFDKFLTQEWQRGVRGGSTGLSVIMLDVDYFGHYNNYYGHLAGDLCLQQVAATLQKIVERSTDLVARYGGEEFCCVMPGTSLSGAIHVAEKIQEAIAELAIPHQKSDVSPFLTVSMGVVTTIPHMSSTVTDLLKEADRQLYLAKRMGRNRFYYEEYKNLQP